jgi:glycosyltransferase involved in cell wall biosynthesis
MPTFLLVMNFKPRLHRPLEHWLIGLARGLKERGGRLHIVLSAEPVEWWAAEIAPYADFTVVPEIREKWRFRPLLPVLKQVRPQAISFIFVPMGDVRTWLLARWPGVGIKRRLYLDHNSWEASQKIGPKAWIAMIRGKITGFAFNEFISISEYNRRRNVERIYIPARKNRVIWNGVLAPAENTTTTEPLPAAEPYVFYVGQLMREKGVHTLLHAWADLPEESRRDPRTGVPARLWLAGMGKQEEQMKGLAEELGITGTVRFLGLRNDVPALMRGALANVIPSEWAEGFGLTAAEALAAGRPVVVSDAGALPEVVGDCGFIFKKGDSDALGAALTRAVTAGAGPDWDGARLQRRYQENFRLERMTADYLDAFTKALDL